MTRHRAQPGEDMRSGTELAIGHSDASSRELMKSKRVGDSGTVEDRAIEMTEQLACSLTEGDEWADIGMSELSGEMTIRAAARGGEPHFILVSMQSEHGKARITRMSCCEHLQELAERILQTEAGGYTQL